MSYFATENHVTPIVIPEMSRELSVKDTVSLWKIYRLMRREKPTIICTHTAKAGTLGRVAGFLYRWVTPSALIGKPRSICLVHTYHGHVFHSYYGPRKTAFFLFIERMLARATDRILVLSEQQLREIHTDFAVGRDAQFRILRLGIDLAPFENSARQRHILRAEIGARDDEILVGIVGRLTEVKNHKLFLQIAKLWFDQADANLPKARFVIVGDGNLRGALETEAAALGLQSDKLVFVGERRDPQVFYPALDIAALTSLNEGTPLTLIEAMANERAVISTAVGGVVDLLDAKNQTADDFEVATRGIAVETENAAAFVRGLRHLVENPDLRHTFGTRGLQYVRDNYSKERLLRDIEKIYRELLPD